MIGDSDPEARVGVVFNFIDPDNYHELTVSAAGDIRGRTLVGGVINESQVVRVTAPGVNKWFSLSIRRTTHPGIMFADVRVNGAALDGLITGGSLPDGDVGLISFSRTARFDDFRVQSFGRLTDPYFEGFSRQQGEEIRGWNLLAGRWFPQGFLDHRDGAATALIASPIVNHLALDTRPSRVYTFRTLVGHRDDGDNVAGIAFIRDVNN